MTRKEFKNTIDNIFQEEPREIIWRFSKDGYEQFEKALKEYEYRSNV